MNSHKGGPQPSSATHRVRPPGELTPGDSESGCKSEVSVKGRASAGTGSPVLRVWEKDGVGACMGSHPRINTYHCLSEKGVISSQKGGGYSFHLLAFSFVVTFDRSLPLVILPSRTLSAFQLHSGRIMKCSE